MNKNTYNFSILFGVTLTSIGAGLVYFPAGFITAGVLVLSLTVYSVERLRSS